jgi:PHD/YefM family antitoxin component YafN of YafNO toxin-antitoxin module
MRELGVENDKLKGAQQNASKKLEEMVELYSKLSEDYVELKKKENDTFEKYVIASQEKERVLTDSEAQFAHYKTKIKLLEEVLTKRNEEYKEITMKYRKVVIFISMIQ